MGKGQRVQDCYVSMAMIFASCLLGLVGLTPAVATEPSPASIELRRGQLDAEVSAAPLAEVLRQVAEKAGFLLEVRGDLGQVQPQAFEGVPVDEAIRRLVGDNQVNLIMRYEAGETGERRLVEVTARAAGEVPAAFLKRRRMRTELSRVRIPPPPPPPPPMQ